MCAGIGENDEEGRRGDGIRASRGRSFVVLGVAIEQKRVKVNLVKCPGRNGRIR